MKIQYFEYTYGRNTYTQKRKTKEVEDLKPCPFCGTKVLFLRQEPLSSGKTNGCKEEFLCSLEHPLPYRLQNKDIIPSCILSGRSFYIGTISNDTEKIEKFVEYWNKRESEE